MRKKIFDINLDLYVIFYILFIFYNAKIRICDNNPTKEELEIYF